MEVKYTKHFLNKLEDVFSESEYILRYEKGNFKSGYCLLQHNKVAVVNKYYPTEGKINCLIDILKSINLDPDQLSREKPEIYVGPARIRKTIVTVTFLGTGTSQGIPVIGCSCKVCQSLDFRDKRLRTSVHLAVNNMSLVIDTGPDFRQQMLREHIHKLDAVLFTHEHKDHTAGLDDIRPFNFRQKRDMPIYARQQVIEQIKTEFAYAFSEKRYPGVPQITPHAITNEPFEINHLSIEPIEVFHYKLPVFGFRIGGFTYITDASYISPEEKEKIKNSEVLVLNALQKEEHISHFTLGEALAVIDELKPKKAYLTHISHRLGLHDEISNELPENVAMAYDGLKLNL